MCRLYTVVGYRLKKAKTIEKKIFKKILKGW